ncbi:putative immunoglobulin-blocking virulence protein [Metamycoplasma alkalescens]|uniref:putative immunoglobulin-blocking virulence protein n=1 Tax=Metamycoplasma alkalescens TaxID=45363 RepID=UPI003D082146
MKKYLNKKNKIIALSLGMSLFTAAGIGIFLFSQNHKNNFGIGYQNHGSNDPEIFDRNNADTRNATVSHTDRNLVESKAPIVIEKEEEKLKPVEPIVHPQPKPTPEIKPNPQPASPAPETFKTERRLVNINGENVWAIVQVAPNRVLNKEDIAAGITNKDPYRAQIVGKIISVEVTKELKESVRKKLLNDGYNSLQTYQSKFFDSLPDTDTTDFKFDDFVKQNYTAWEKMVDRFRKLLDSPNVVKFLKPDAVAEYVKPKQFASTNLKYAWLIRHLDYTKFTKLSGTAEKYLNEGLTATQDNVYVNENGELDSYSYGPPSEFNVVTSRIERDNKERRVFSMSGHFGRSPHDIASGEYPGWTKNDVTKDDKFKEFGVGQDDDIKIFELTKNEKEKDGSQRKGYAVEIDANNFAGYDKTVNLIKSLQEKNIEITSYRIKNMGDKDPSQKFKDILNSLPKNLPHLELFFSERATNTSSLIALEDKDIKELSIFTLGNALLDNWSINPWAIKNVRWVNTVDYNVNWNLKKPFPSRIVFNTLAFEESDIKNSESSLDKKLERINYGLRMAYYVRNNEGVFQSGFGPGLNPDTNEGNNSYPTRLDFSRAPSMKSLKGLIFHDIRNSNNKPRKLKYLKFYNNKNYFELTTDDLDQGQLDKIMAHDEQGPPKTKIEFENGKETQSIKFKDSKELTTSGLSNLNILVTLSEIPRVIIVPSGANELKAQLERNGYKVTESDGTDELIFN